jgi:ribonuclease J|tara:strand:+ start:111 stop:1448 length:1338 start_codon:yes stop_codon:yes gene_type:complete
MIEVCSVGGYSEVGKNMTALKIDDEVIIFDMGIFLPAIINYEEEGNDRESLDREGMIKLGAVPDDSVINDWKGKVKAILCGHCHLDHIAAIPHLADEYKAPIYGTPFTIEVIKQMLQDDKIKIRNGLRVVNVNSKVRISDNIEVEFINMTHSTLQTAIMAVHCKYGTIVYGNDFKFDSTPVLGKKPNFKRLRELGNENVILLILDSLYADLEMKTPSEKVAREMLKEVMLGTETKESLVFVTTFASHLARLKSVIDFAKVMNRKVLFLGRSMMKYTKAAEKCGLVDFSKKVEIVAYARQIKARLKRLEKEKRSKYVVVATGNQGEPDAVLSKMTDGRLPFRFEAADQVIFSCRVIPDPVNVENRKKLEDKLKANRVRIFTNIHVSGHAAREDHRDMLAILKPKYIMPAHDGRKKQLFMQELAMEEGYKEDKILLMDDGKRVKLKL